jgi:hypothetical protein
MVVAFQPGVHQERGVTYPIILSNIFMIHIDDGPRLKKYLVKMKVQNMNKNSDLVSTHHELFFSFANTVKVNLINQGKKINLLTF